MFKAHGVPLSRVFVYLLVTADIAEADLRVQTLHRLCKSFNLYAQPERNIGIEPTQNQKLFAGRYVYKGAYKKETWAEYLERI
jgi:hypothetical protein